MPDPAVMGSSVRRNAFYLVSQGAPLLAWLHQPADPPIAAHGVVICAPLGVEQLNAHRAIRHWADAIALQGMPVVRFDYHGTGDSAGTDEDPQRVATWLTNIADAATWMREQLGCRQISFSGLRMGAALATLAATRQDIDNLVLWAPVIKGRRYCRELRAVSLMAEGTATADAAPTGAIAAAGFVTTQETLDAIAGMDLLKLSPRCKQALIVERDDIASDTQLKDHLSALGIGAEQVVQPGYVDAMAEPHYTRVPQAAIAHMAQWLHARAGTEASAAATDIPLTTTISPAIREHLCPISTAPHLFGILCEPTQPRADDRPLIVILNAGSAHHTGPGRLTVELARQLAVASFRTLRVDHCGLGDSILADATHENDPYLSTAFRDITITLHYAQQVCGAQRVALLGLCSGAYYAFQSAVQIADPALVESILINPRTYFWRAGMTLGDTNDARMNAMHYYLNAITDPRKWLRLLGGGSDAGVLGGLKLFVQRMRASSGVKPATSTAPYVANDETGHPARQDLPGDLNRVMKSGRNLALFCATTDPGHFLLMYQARRNATRMERSGKLACLFIDNADHTFSVPSARLRLINKIVQYLHQRYAPQVNR